MTAQKMTLNWSKRRAALHWSGVLNKGVYYRHVYDIVSELDVYPGGVVTAQKMTLNWSKRRAALHWSGVLNKGV